MLEEIQLTEESAYYYHQLDKIGNILKNYITPGLYEQNEQQIEELHKKTSECLEAGNDKGLTEYTLKMMQCNIKLVQEILESSDNIPYLIRALMEQRPDRAKKLYSINADLMAKGHGDHLKLETLPGHITALTEDIDHLIEDIDRSKLKLLYKNINTLIQDEEIRDRDKEILITMRQMIDDSGLIELTSEPDPEPTVSQARERARSVIELTTEPAPEPTARQAQGRARSGSGTSLSL